MSICTLGGTAYTLSYDYDGQLTQITQGQNTTDFAYDALGRRFSRTAGGTTTEFLYGAGGMVLEKQGGSYTQAYTQANGLLRRGAEYPLFDGHGSERTVTNSSQTVTGSVNYEAFGQVAGSTGSSTNPYMYAGDWGYRNDGDAGLMHVGARYYDAQVGRFITRDTVLSEHPYLYCEHEPVGFVDPSGHFFVCVSWFHCWIEYPEGSIGFWPGGGDALTGGPGEWVSPDPYGRQKHWAIPIFWVPWGRADDLIRGFGDRVRGGGGPGGGTVGGWYQFPFSCCVQGAVDLARGAVTGAVGGAIIDAVRTIGGWLRRSP